MKQNTKRLLTAIILLLLIHLSPVLAATGSMSSAQTHGGSGSGGSPYSGGPGSGPPPKDSHTYNSGDGKQYVCRYYNNIQRDRDIVANAYDMDGHSLIPNKFTAMNPYPLYAGTWIGVNINEKKMVSWNFTDFEYKELKQKYICYYKGTQYSTRNDVCGHFSKGRCVAGPTKYGFCPCYTSRTTSETVVATDYKTISAGEKMTNSKCPYKAGYSVSKFEPVGGVIEEDSTNSYANSQCRSQAIKKDLSAALGYLNNPSIDITFNTSNKASETVASHGEILSSTKNIPNLNSPPTSGTAYAEYIIGPKKTCIDVVNGLIYYNEKCDSNKKTIENTTIYEPSLGKNLTCWHYFIPLDAKTNTKYTIVVFDRNDEVLSVNECDYVIDHYDDYVKLIQPVDKNGRIIMNGYTNNPKYDKGKECSFAVTIDFSDNIVQKFYGETKKDKTLKGYGMYFRQINIANPFPNGLNDYSYWNSDVYNKSNKKVNGTTVLATSFNNPSYIANMTKSNIDLVQKYNENNQYTQWVADSENGVKLYGMNSNGSSVFINKYNNTIFRDNSSIYSNVTVKKSKYYKLGCGPANKDWSGCK